MSRNLPPRRDSQPGTAMTPPAGGVAVRGATQRIAAGRSLEAVEPPAIDAAVQQLLSGRGAYRAICTLARVSGEDVGLLFKASLDADPGARWAKFWVLSSFVSKGMRNLAGREVGTAELRADLAHAHFLALFVGKKNRSAARALERARDGLLGHVLQQLAQAHSNPRRQQVLIGIIEHLETQDAPLREAIRVALGEETIDAMLPTLVVKEDPRHARADSRRLSRNLSSQLQAIKEDDLGEPDE